jgi:FtsZ-binding cell division protein ZapB
MKTPEQTAVEWLIKQLTPSISLQQKHIDELKEEAKEMEREQIANAFYESYVNAYSKIFKKK